jgi:DnaJ homolog subfamily C member 3
LKKLEVPASISPLRISERRKDAYRTMCQAYVKLEQAKKAEWWCEELLRFEGNEEDVDGLIGRGEAALIKEDWEDAVRALEKAFEVSGRSNQDVSTCMFWSERLLIGM